jgi:hypothetical protein
MSPLAPALDLLAAQVAELTGNSGRRVDVTSLGVLDREGHLPLDRPGLSSPNGACRLFRAADGWMAVNLARTEDHDLIPAWLGCDVGDAPWDAIARGGARHTRATLVESAALLGLPAGAVGEVVRDGPEAPRLRFGEGRSRPGGLRVIDLSALWAGPLCGAILAAMGALVTRVESPHRPDPTRTSTPEFFRRLNDAKRELSLDLTGASGRAQLREAVGAADILITSARPRAFAGLGLDPGQVFAANPGMVWVAVTAYGWSGAAAARVGFGDDTAAAGGLVGWTADGAPGFLGDALADPITGLAAAVGALRAVEAGGGFLVDVSLAGSAAGAAALCGLRRAA